MAKKNVTIDLLSIVIAAMILLFLVYLIIYFISKS